VNVLEGVIQANIISKLTTNSSAWDFLTAGTPMNPDTLIAGDGSLTLTLKEMLNWTGGSNNVGADYAGMKPGELIWTNIKAGWMEAVVSGALVTVGFRLGSKVLKRPRAQANRALKQLGLGDVVRI